MREGGDCMSLFSIMYRENDLLKEQMKLIVQRREPTLRPSDSSMGMPL